MDIKTVIRNRRLELDLTEQQLGDRVGVSRASVQQWERGSTAPKRKNQQAVADALEITVAELMQVSIEFPSANNQTARKTNDNEIAIPQFGTGGAMGVGIVLKDQPGCIQNWQVTNEWLQKNVPHYTATSNLAIVTGFGDSMLGMYNPGDPLLVDRGITKADVDGVYFFRVGDEGFIKRLQRIPGQGILVISENQKYRDWTITPSMDFEIFAKVLKAWNGQNL